MSLQKFQSTFTWPELEPGERVPIKGRAKQPRGDYAAPISAKSGNPFLIEQKPEKPIREKKDKGYKLVRSTKRGKKVIVKDDPMEEYDAVMGVKEDLQKRHGRLRKFGSWAGKFLVK